MPWFFPGVHNQFNTGKIQGTYDFEGFLVSDPIPNLIVPRSGDLTNNVAFSRYILSGTGKTAAKPEVLAHSGEWVKLNGILVSRNQLSVIAARSAEPIAPPNDKTLLPDSKTDLGQYSLTGEILDGKCYPRCHETRDRVNLIVLVPFAVLVGVFLRFFVCRTSRTKSCTFLLTDEQGKAVNDRVLDLVADPIEITGNVIQYDDMFVLQADPTTYKRV